MTSSKQIFRHIILSPYILMTTILPLIIYNVGNVISGPELALTLSFLWAIFLRVKFSLGNFYPIICMIIVSGIFHLLWNMHPGVFYIKREDVFLSLTGTFSALIIFLYGIFIGKGTIQRFAEVAKPEIKKTPFYGSDKYKKTWRQVDIIWVTGMSIKVLLLFIFYKYSPTSTGTTLFILGWPLTILLIYLSVHWPVRRLNK